MPLFTRQQAAACVGSLTDHSQITHKPLMHHSLISHRSVTHHSQITHIHRTLYCMGSQLVTLMQNTAISNQLLQHAMVLQAVTWYAGMFPVSGADFEALNAAVERLTLNDASVSVKRENSAALGAGFRCGSVPCFARDCPV